MSIDSIFDLSILYASSPEAGEDDLDVTELLRSALGPENPTPDANLRTGQTYSESPEVNPDDTLSLENLGMQKSDFEIVVTPDLGDLVDKKVFWSPNAITAEDLLDFEPTYDYEFSQAVRDLNEAHFLASLIPVGYIYVHFSRKMRLDLL